MSEKKKVSPVIQAVPAPQRHTRILESSAASQHESLPVGLEEGDRPQPTAVPDLESLQRRRLHGAQFWSVGRSKPVIGNNLHPFPAQKARKAEGQHRLAAEARRKQSKDGGQRGAEKGHGAHGGRRQDTRRNGVASQLEKNLQVRKMSLCGPPVSIPVGRAKKDAAEAVEQASSQLLGLLLEAEQHLAEKSSERFGGSSGTGPHSPQLVATLDGAEGRLPGRGRAPWRQPISGLLLPAPDFLYHGTPEKSDEVQEMEDGRQTIFGISHHDTGNQRLRSGELFLAQNSSRSNTQPPCTPLEHKATEALLGEPRLERRNVALQAFRPVVGGDPGTLDEAIAQAASEQASPRPRAGIGENKKDKSKVQRPVALVQECQPGAKQTQRKMLAGPFQKVNTQRLKQMLAGGGGHARAAASLKAEPANLQAISGTAATIASPLRHTNLAAATPTPLAVDRKKSAQSGCTPASSTPACNAVEASPLKGALSRLIEGAQEAEPAPPISQPSPSRMLPFEGLKLWRVIEKIELKAISAERKRDLLEKLDLPEFKLRLSKLSAQRANAPLGLPLDGMASLLGVAEASLTGPANAPESRTLGSELMKHSARRKANFPARDSPEQSEVSISSARRPDKIVRSTLAAERRAANDDEGKHQVGNRRGAEKDAATKAQPRKHDGLKLEGAEVAPVEAPLGGEEPGDAGGSLNRLVKAKGRHSEKASPSLLQPTSAAQAISAAPQTARGRHETEERDLGRLSGAIDVESQPHDNDYAVAPVRTGGAGAKHQTAASFQDERAASGTAVHAYRKPDPMLKHWNQNNAFLKQRKPRRAVGQRGTVIFCQGRRLATQEATPAQWQSSGCDGLPYATKQTDSKDTVVQTLPSEPLANQRPPANELRASALTGRLGNSSHPGGVGASPLPGLSPRQRVTPVAAIAQSPPEQVRSQLRAIHASDKSSNETSRAGGDSAVLAPPTTIRVEAVGQRGVKATSLGFGGPVAVVAVPKAGSEQPASAFHRANGNETDQQAQAKGQSGQTAQRDLAAEAQNTQAAENGELEPSMVEISKKERREEQDLMQQHESFDDIDQAAYSPMLQEFGPLKTCAFPIDPEYDDLRTKSATGKSKYPPQKKARTSAMSASPAKDGIARATPEDERAIHTQLIPTSYPIPASALLEKKPIGYQLHSKGTRSTLEAPSHLVGFAEPPNRQEEPRLSPRLQKMKATPKFRQNERKQVKDRLMESMDKADLQEAQNSGRSDQSHPERQWYKPFPSERLREGKDTSRRASTYSGHQSRGDPAKLQQTQLRMKEYWLPLGLMPQDKEYIEVLDKIYESLAAGPLADAQKAKELRAPKGAMHRTVDVEQSHSRPKPLLGAQLLHPSHGHQSGQGANPQSRATPELPRVGTGAGEGRQLEAQARWRPVAHEDYHSLEAALLGRQNQQGLHLGRGQSHSPAMCITDTPGIVNDEPERVPPTHVSSAMDYLQSQGRASATSGPDPGLEQESCGDNSSQRPMNTMKTIIQTNKGADGHLPPSSLSQQQPGQLRSGLAGQRSHGSGEEPELMEKSRNERLLSDVVARLVQNRKLAEQLLHIKRKQEETSNNAAKRSLVPFFAPSMLAEANPRCPRNGRQQTQGRPGTHLRTQPTGSSIERALRQTQLENGLRAALASGGSQGSTESRIQSNLGATRAWRASHSGAADPPQTSSSGRPASRSIALSALGEMLSSTLKSQFKSPFTNEAIAGLNAIRTVNPDALSLIAEQAHLPTRPVRGQTPNPALTSHHQRRLPSLGSRQYATPHRSSNEAPTPFRALFTASTGRRKYGANQQHPGGIRVQKVAMMPESCSFRLHQIEPPLRDGNSSAAGTLQIGQRKVHLGGTAGQTELTFSLWDKRGGTAEQEGPHIKPIVDVRASADDEGTRSAGGWKVAADEAGRRHERLGSSGRPALDQDHGPLSGTNAESRTSTPRRPSPTASLGLTTLGKEMKIAKNVLGTTKYYQHATEPEENSRAEPQPLPARQQANGPSLFFKLEQQPPPHQVSSKSLLLSCQQGTPSPPAGRGGREGDSVTLMKRASLGSQMNSLSSRKEHRPQSSRKFALQDSGHQDTIDPENLPQIILQNRKARRSKAYKDQQMSAMAIQTDFQDFSSTVEAGLRREGESPPNNNKDQPSEIFAKNENQPHAQKSAAQRRPGQKQNQNQVIRVGNVVPHPSHNALSQNTFAGASKEELTLAAEPSEARSKARAGKSRPDTDAIVQALENAAHGGKQPAQAPTEQTGPAEDNMNSHTTAQLPSRIVLAVGNASRLAKQREEQRVEAPGRPELHVYGPGSGLNRGPNHSADPGSRPKARPEVPKLQLSRLLKGSSKSQLQRPPSNAASLGPLAATQAAHGATVEARPGASSPLPQSLPDSTLNSQTLSYMLAGVPAGYSLLEFERRPSVAIKEGTSQPKTQASQRTRARQGAPKEVEAAAGATKMKKHTSFWRQIHQNRGINAKPKATKKVGQAPTKRPLKNQAAKEVDPWSVDGLRPGSQAPQPSLIQAMQNIDHPQYVRMHQEWIELIQIPRTSIVAAGTNLPDEARLRTVLATQRGRKPLPSPNLNTRRQQETGRRREIVLDPKGEQKDAGPPDPLPTQRLQASPDDVAGGLSSVQVQGVKIDQVALMHSAMPSPRLMPPTAIPDGAGDFERAHLADESATLPEHGGTSLRVDTEKRCRDSIREGEGVTTSGAVIVEAKATGVDRAVGAPAMKPLGGQEMMNQASPVSISRHYADFIADGPETATEARGPSRSQDRHLDSFPNADLLATPGPQTPEGLRDALYSSENNSKAGHGVGDSSLGHAKVEAQKDEPLLVT